MDKPKVRIKVSEVTCGLDKKQRFLTTLNRATPIDDETLIKYASDDSGGEFCENGPLITVRY